jgi:hypothetical protein
MTAPGEFLQIHLNDAIRWESDGCQDPALDVRKLRNSSQKMERETGFEPATSSLGTCTSFGNKELLRPWRKS